MAARALNRSEVRVGIFWDIENIVPPSQIRPFETANHIKAIGNRYGTITAFKAYLDLRTAQVSKIAEQCAQLQHAGVSLTDCPHIGLQQKEIADKMLLVDAMGFAIDNPAPAVVIVITGDRDFAYAISFLRQRRYHTVLIAPSVGTRINSALLAAPNTVIPLDEVIGTRPPNLAIERINVAPSLVNSVDLGEQILPERPLNPHVAEDRDVNGTSAVMRSGPPPGEAPASPASVGEFCPSLQDEYIKPSIPAPFQGLVDVILNTDLDAMGVRWRVVREALAEREPNLLNKLGMSEWSQYLDLAERVDIVCVRKDQSRYVVLHPELDAALRGPQSGSLRCHSPASTSSWLTAMENADPFPSNPTLVPPVSPEDTKTVVVAPDPLRLAGSASAVAPGCMGQEAASNDPPTLAASVLTLPTSTLTVLPTPLPTPLATSTKPTQARLVSAISTHSRTASAPSSSVTRLGSAQAAIPPKFRDLITAVQMCPTRPNWANVAEALLKKNSDLWNPGNGRFGLYIDEAARLNLVNVAGTHPTKHISVHPSRR